MKIHQKEKSQLMVFIDAKTREQIFDVMDETGLPIKISMTKLARVLLHLYSLGEIDLTAEEILKIDPDPRDAKGERNRVQK